MGSPLLARSAFSVTVLPLAEVPLPPTALLALAEQK